MSQMKTSDHQCARIDAAAHASHNSNDASVKKLNSRRAIGIPAWRDHRHDMRPSEPSDLSRSTGFYPKGFSGPATYSSQAASL